MSKLQVGQVLSLKIRYNNDGVKSTVNHPYLIVDINDDLGVVEIVQIDSLANKEYKAFFRSNKVLFCSNPHETVIDEDSFVQLDNTFKIEDFDELINYRRQTDKLSSSKLNSVISAYRNYHTNNEIDENKNVYMDKEEILSLN